MIDPERLHDSGTNEERRLIALARADQPPSGAVARALSTLGVIGTVTLGPAAAHAAGLATGGAVSGAATAAAANTTAGSTLTFATLAKWLGLGLLGGTLSVAAATAPSLVTRSGTANSSATGTPSSLPARGPKAAKPPTAESRPRPEPARTSLTADPTGAASAPDTLSEELALLESARRALARNRPAEARELLGHHRARFRSPALSEEADVLRIEAAFAGGEIDLAEHAARDFLDSRPTSPHAPRVRALLSRSKRDPKAIDWPSDR